MKPNTRFMTHYLAAVGSLQTSPRRRPRARRREHRRRACRAPRRAGARRARRPCCCDRPRRLLADPHALAGFIGLHRRVGCGRREGDEIRFRANPIHFLRELYHYLHMDYAPEQAGVRDDLAARRRDPARRASPSTGTSPSCTGVDDWLETQKLFEGGRERRDRAATTRALGGLPRRPPRLPARSRPAAGDPADRRPRGLRRDRASTTARAGLPGAHSSRIPRSRPV